MDRRGFLKSLIGGTAGVMSSTFVLPRTYVVDGREDPPERFELEPSIRIGGLALLDEYGGRIHESPLLKCITLTPGDTLNINWKIDAK